MSKYFTVLAYPWKSSFKTKNANFMFTCVKAEYGDDKKNLGIHCYLELFLFDPNSEIAELIQ